MLKTKEYVDLFKQPARQVYGQIKVRYGGEDLALFTPDTNLVSFSIEKTAPNGKVFGFAISQKITVEVLGIIDTVQKGYGLLPTLGIRDGESVELPYFYVDSIEINKVNQTTKIVGYDIIGKNENYAWLRYNSGTQSGYLTDITTWFKLSGTQVTIDPTCVNTTIALGTYGPNIANSETVHSVMTQAAEALGAVCYATTGNNIRFRRLTTDVVDTLTPSDYFDFSTGETITLTLVGSTNGLEDQYTYGYTGDGRSQILYENGFVTATQSTIKPMVDNLGEALVGETRTAYKLEWRGCPAYEIGDYLAIQEKDGEVKHIYYYGETLTYNGGLRAVSEWEVIEGDKINAKPTTLSAALTQTYARVDRAANEVTIMASKVDEAVEDVATLKITTNEISASVSSLENAVETRLSDESLTILVNNKVSSVQTTTGFTFDANGMNITKSGASTSTQITENGMTVSDVHGNSLLTANSSGVDAKDLKATTYLFIGEVSRFENYVDEEGSTRTACFVLG